MILRRTVEGVLLFSAFCGFIFICGMQVSAQDKPPPPLNIQYQISSENCLDNNGNVDCNNPDCSDQLACGWCGDGECSEGESESGCPIDCGEHPYKNFPSFANIQQLSDMAALDIHYEDLQKEQTEVTIMEMKRVIGRLDPALAVRIEQEGVVLSASILDSKRALARTFKIVAEELKEESKEFRKYVISLMTKPIILNRLKNFGVHKQLIAAIEANDLVKTRQNLPKPKRSVSENINKLRLLNEVLPNLQVRTNDDHIIIPIAIAEESTDIIDAKAGFKHAVDAAEEITKDAVDPEKNIDPLLADIQRLQNRGNTLSGILGIVDGDVKNNLAEARKNMQDNSTESFISVSGILSYLRSTANFQVLEESYNSAVSRMQTGIGKLRSLFAFRGISLKAEAATLLDEEMLQGLSSEKIDDQRETLSLLIQQEKKVFQDTILSLPEEDQQLLTEQWNVLEEVLNDAETTGDIRKIAGNLSVLMKEVQHNMRNGKNIFKRMIYSLQDFFGRSSANI